MTGPVDTTVITVVGPLTLRRRAELPKVEVWMGRAQLGWVLCDDMGRTTLVALHLSPEPALQRQALHQIEKALPRLFEIAA